MSVERLAAIRAEQAWRRFCDGPMPFMLECVKIKHPSRGCISFPVSAAQKETLEAFEAHDNVCILKARQIGFSTLVAAYVLWLAVTRPDQNIVMLSKKQEDARDLIRKVKYAHDRLPAWVRQRIGRPVTANADKLEFSNGSLIEALPSKKDPARSKSVSLIVCDEFAFFEDPENAWASIEPTADVGGRIILLSTANGAGTLFEHFYNTAKAGQGSAFGKSLFFPWWAAEGRDEAWATSKRENTPEWQFWQEYPSNDVECWIRSGNAMFEVSVIESWPELPPREGQVHEMGTGWTFLDNPAGGPTQVWEWPKPESSYVIGADVAEGIGGDFSTARVLKLPEMMANGQLSPLVEVAAYHGQIDPDEFGILCAGLGFFYGEALLGIESNQHGHTAIVAARKQAGYRKQYRRRKFAQGGKEKTVKDQLGWHTNKLTRPKMLDDLGAMIREGQVVSFDPKMKYELQTFVLDADGKSHGSPFDDRTVALAIAVQMASSVTIRRQRSGVASNQPARGSFEDHMRSLAKRGSADRPALAQLRG